MNYNKIVSTTLLIAAITSVTTLGVNDYKVKQERLATIASLNEQVYDSTNLTNTLQQDSKNLQDINKNLNIELSKQKDLVASLLTEKVNTRYSTFEITAYSPFDDVTGINADGDPTNTSVGFYPGPNIIAVDPTVIPYFSEVTIIYENGETLNAIAGDCGGAIKGNRIDVYKDTFDEASQHGRRKAIVLWKEAK